MIKMDEEQKEDMEKQMKETRSPQGEKANEPY